MRDKLNSIDETGLQFYGKITASVSHEIKNVLAIINENAGLLEDFTFMADRGTPIDPGRLKSMAAAVKKQVERADKILKNMNRFAHSTDNTFTDVDLNQTIALFVALAERFAEMRGVTVDRHLTANPIMITTAPFFLIDLLWQCLDFCMSASGDDKQVALVVEESENIVRIRFQKLAGLTGDLSDRFPSDRERNLLGMLKADLSIDAECQEMILQLPIAFAQE
jgi:signal transduction histidine kinase